LKSDDVTEIVAVRSSALISTFATPGSVSKALFTLARQPPQVMPGQLNLIIIATDSVGSAAGAESDGSLAGAGSDWLLAGTV